MPRVVQVMFIVYKVTVKEVPIQNVGSSPSLIFPPLLHINCTHVPSMLYSQDTT
jgi:hypothetical protein